MTSKDYRAFYANNFKIFTFPSEVLLNMGRMSPRLDVSGGQQGFNNDIECQVILSPEALQVLHQVIGEALANMRVITNKH